MCWPIFAEGSQQLLGRPSVRSPRPWSSLFRVDLLLSFARVGEHGRGFRWALNINDWKPRGGADGEEFRLLLLTKHAASCRHRTDVAALRFASAGALC